ncbi:retrovirus-related pol polyprotein from transposon TNT 1-94 [Tanacetum coccineum]
MKKGERTLGASSILKGLFQRKRKELSTWKRTWTRDAFIFVVVVVSKAGDEEEKMSIKKMRTYDGLHIEEVVGEDFNLKEDHMRYGHLNFGDLKLLSSKGIVKGLDQIDHLNQRRSKAFEAFKKFKAMVEKEKGLKIKSMRLDSGGEFLSKEFNKFCEDNRRFLTAPYSPQQNGVVERKNRTILNTVEAC